MSDEPVDLATAAPFRIGGLTVDPGLREVSGGVGEPEALEPRVMQVFVALARANGAIVGRDALVAQCWEARIVGDDSINRVVSRLRRLAADRGATFQIQTITRAGYRLIGDVAPVVPPAPPASAHAGPVRRSPGWWVAAAAAIVIVAAAAAWRHWSAPSLARPVVDVAAFVPAAGVDPALAPALQAETASFLANEKFYGVAMAAGNTADWHLGGTIAPAGNDIVVFARLTRPGSDVAVVELRIQRDAHAPMLARALGLRIGRTAGCTLLGVANPELTGGYVEAAMPAFAASCSAWHDKTTSLALRIDRFRDAATALPRSAYFRARLGEMLGDQAAEQPADAARLRAEGNGFVAAAAAIDPTQPHLFLARARLRPANDFTGREAMLAQAVAARPSDCACEFGDTSTFLSMVGRNAEARALAARAREKEPKNIVWMRRAGEAAAAAGAFDAADAQLAEVATLLPDPSTLDDARMNLAVWSGRWPLALAMAARQPQAELRTAQATLITALATHDPARVHAAARPFLARARTPANDRATVAALAMAGEPDAAVAAADRFLAAHPLSLAVVFEPSFAAARATPAFAALARKVGLIAYWRTSRHRPDLCAAAQAPRFCATI